MDIVIIGLTFYLSLDIIIYHMLVLITKIEYMGYFVWYFSLISTGCFHFNFTGFKISASIFVSGAWRSLLCMLCILSVLLFKVSNSSLRERCILDDVVGVDLGELSQVCCMFNKDEQFEEVCFLTFSLRHLFTKMWRVPNNQIRKTSV